LIICNADRGCAAKLPIWLGALVLFSGFISAQYPTAAAEHKQPIAGQLLVATENMKDPRFVESVIYIVKHDDEGTLGLVINKPIARGPIDDLLKGFGSEVQASKRDIVIHYGGPVSTRQGFLLHSDDVMLESSMKTRDAIAMTSDIRMIEAIALGKGPQQFLFTLGYAGWAPGQLEGELAINSWALVPADKSLIFDKDAEKKWRQAIDKRQISL
jgi:putative transcriptional regulator